MKAHGTSKRTARQSGRTKGTGAATGKQGRRGQAAHGCRQPSAKARDKRGTAQGRGQPGAACSMRTGAQLPGDRDGTANAAREMARRLFDWVDAVNAARRETAHPLCFDDELIAWGVAKLGGARGEYTNAILEARKLFEEEERNAAQWRRFFARCRDIQLYLMKEKTEQERTRFVLAVVGRTFPTFKGAHPPCPFQSIKDRENRKAARQVLAMLRLIIRLEMKEFALEDWRQTENQFFNDDEQSKQGRYFKSLMDGVKRNNNKRVYNATLEQLRALSGENETRKMQLQRCIDWMKGEKGAGHAPTICEAARQFGNEINAEVESGGFDNAEALEQALRRIAQDEKQGKCNKWGIVGVAEFLKSGRGRPKGAAPQS